jgi:pimeloyl-ACP methyl ester carboxylesterase
MGKALAWIVAIAAVMAAIAVGGRAYAAREMSSRAVTPKSLGAATPATADLPYARLAFEAADRTLIGWWVRAPTDSGRPAPAVLFLHGNRSSISDYVDLQKFFYRQGVSSMVFDYSGFGASGGEPTLKNAIADAGSVAKVFADSAGQKARKVAMGSALGSTVLLQAIDSVQPHIDGIVIEGVDASVRESAIRSGRLPKILARLVEEPGDNVSAASRVRVPLLAVHSYADARVPITDAERVVAAVPSQASLVRHWRKGHSALLASSRPCDWAPVLFFVKSGTLPAVKLDTTDACKVEAERLQAEKRITDSLNAAKAAAAAEQAALARAKAAAETKTTTTKTGVKSTTTKTAPTKTAPTKAAPTKTGAKRPAPAKRPE